MAEFNGALRELDHIGPGVAINSFRLTAPKLLPMQPGPTIMRRLVETMRRQGFAFIFLLAGWILVFDAIAQSPPSGLPVDHRVAIESNAWPWSSIGRINVILSMGERSSCTGTLIGSRLVLTAAHCLYNERARKWVASDTIHFVAGQSRDHFQAHAIAKSYVTGIGFATPIERHQVAANMVQKDWALVELRETLPLRPIPWQAIPESDLAKATVNGIIARAGYGADRPYLLSVHWGCTIRAEPDEVDEFTHSCDSQPGDSGSPILLIRDNSAVVIGLHSSVMHFSGNIKKAVSAMAFDQEARRRDRP
jgi:protease YdgD